MTRLNITKQPFTLITGLCALAFSVIVFNSHAEAQLSTLSGRVSKANGEPIAESTVILISVTLQNDGLVNLLYNKALYPFLAQRHPVHLSPNSRQNTPNEETLRKRPPFLKTETDAEGNFTITGQISGTVQLMVLPDGIPEKVESAPANEPRYFKPLPQIQAIKFGKVAFYPYQFISSPKTGAVTFAIKPGAKIENIDIIMKTGPVNQQEIRGKIVFKNRAPLVNAYVTIHIDQLNLDGTDGTSTSHSLQTDVDGNFAVTAGDPPGIYALSVRHRGLTATSELFILKLGENREGLGLTLNGNPAELAEPPESGEKEEGAGFHGVNFPFSLAIYFPLVWIINPENGHAYKAIYCDGRREDAQAKAAAEDAHLVTITSEEEQIWLDIVFGGISYWIGLRYAVEQSKWQWDTGEPLTYMNWELRDLSDPILPNGFRPPPHFRGPQKNYAIMSSKGPWETVESAGIRGGQTQMAIIERDGLHANPPVVEE